MIYPSPYHVAVAIYASAREVAAINEDDADAVAISAAAGDRDDHAPRTLKYPLARTRAYAALALNMATSRGTGKPLFPGLPMPKAARMAGCGTPDVTGPKLLSDFRKGLPWWDPDVFARVCDAVRWAVDREPGNANESEYVIPMRPAVSERQRKALRMLEEAVANTPRR